MTATYTGTDAISEARAAGVGPLEYMQQRGFIQDVSDADGLRAAFAAGPVTFYQGFDPTGPSLHVGHMLGIMMLATLQRFGHRPIALGGGGTALVGDPSGKTSARALVSEQDIRSNLEKILVQFDRHLDFEGGRFGDNPPAILINNADWLLELRYIPFLRDIGRHFSVNEMLTAETYRTRLETTGLNFVEFNYRIVQAYDFLHLFRTEGCTLQLGGSDQWGNIVAGVDLVRRVTGDRVHALTTPLVTKADGTKFGKTESGTVWLSRELTTPYAFFQFWLNSEDSITPSLLRYFSFRSHEEIEALEESLRERPQAREAQRALAEELTDLVHGPGERAKVQAAAQALFGQGELAELDAATLDAALAEAPHAVVPHDEWVQGLSVADALARSGLVASKGAARRTIAEGGAYVANVRATDENALLGPDDLLAGRWVLVRRGRRHIGGIRVLGPDEAPPGT